MPLPVIIILAGLVSGTFSALLGVGGGIILVPVMVILLKVPAKIAVGTSLAVIVPTALVGVIRHYIMGNIDFRLAVLLASGAVVGSYVGTILSQHIPELMVKRAFAVLMVFSAYKMLTSR